MNIDDLKSHIDDRLDAMQQASEARALATNDRIDKLYGRQSDVQQAMANVTHIFSPDGSWPEVVKKVEKHDSIYTKGKTVGGLLALLFGYLGWDFWKNHLHWGGK